MALPRSLARGKRSRAASNNGNSSPASNSRCGSAAGENGRDPIDNSGLAFSEDSPGSGGNNRRRSNANDGRGCAAVMVQSIGHGLGHWAPTGRTPTEIAVGSGESGGTRLPHLRELIETLPALLCPPTIMLSKPVLLSRAQQLAAGLTPPTTPTACPGCIVVFASNLDKNESDRVLLQTECHPFFDAISAFLSAEWSGDARASASESLRRAHLRCWRCNSARKTLKQCGITEGAFIFAYRGACMALVAALSDRLGRPDKGFGSKRGRWPTSAEQLFPGGPERTMCALVRSLEDDIFGVSAIIMGFVSTHRPLAFPVLLTAENRARILAKGGTRTRRILRARGKIDDCAVSASPSRSHAQHTDEFNAQADQRLDGDPDTANVGIVRAADAQRSVTRDRAEVDRKAQVDKNGHFCRVELVFRRTKYKCALAGDTGYAGGKDGKRESRQREWRTCRRPRSRCPARERGETIGGAFVSWDGPRRWRTYSASFALSTRLVGQRSWVRPL
ncbi:hypothetical protein AURDEDRAFT_127597 [Auricularia subglabra TFB-10046 SS5]|nr:hypothetical protein AURDEDRAFT_127597 [Auricularia subglabra TFB-10046 SS5]